jgi:hypothetical protein
LPLRVFTLSYLPEAYLEVNLDRLKDLNTCGLSSTRLKQERATIVANYEKLEDAVLALQDEFSAGTCEGELERDERCKQFLEQKGRER